jgi:hypothetical protein
MVLGSISDKGKPSGVFLKLVVCILLRVLGKVQGIRLILNILFNNNRYMFRSYDHLHEEIYTWTSIITATCFGRMTIFKRKYIYIYFRLYV